MVSTPDFYDYPWQALTSATRTGASVSLRWADGAELVVHHLWLWENAVGDGAVDPVTREGTIDPADMPSNGHWPDTRIGCDGELVVTWPHAESRRFHPGWLRHIADRQHTADAMLPEAVVWTPRTQPEPPLHDAVAVMHDVEARRMWLNDVVRFGVARLHNAPLEPDFIADLARHIGPLRDSNFGLLWSVQVDADPNSTANTARRLAPHTDLPTREIPPGFQILHCLVNTVRGGDSQMTDGMAVVAHLQTHEPDAYEALTTLPWVFFNRSNNDDHRFVGPIIDRRYPGYCGFTLRAFYPVRAFPAMDQADVGEAYEAMRIFSAIASSRQFQVSYPFEAGDLVFFDNRRILHGRDVFDPTDGTRVLRGSYMDQDEVFSRLRVLNRHARTKEANA